MIEQIQHTKERVDTVLCELRVRIEERVKLTVEERVDHFGERINPV